MVKKVGKYELGRTLGEGTFGKVKYATNTETSERVAIKILDKDKIQKQNMGDQIKKEISIMKVVKHVHVVALKEVLASRTKIFIVLELVTGGELFDKIVAQGRLDENTARLYFQQLMSGMEYCHTKGVCHRDLKPENLLLDVSGILKISDFGLSSLYTDPTNGGPASQGEQQKALLHTTCGTPNYVAPEVLGGKGYDGRAADIWSCGVILYVLLAGFLPFDEPNMPALFRKIMKAEFVYPPWFSAPAKALLSRILVPSPQKRVTLDEIKSDDWFKIESGHVCCLPGAYATTTAVISDTDIDSAFEATDEIVEEKRGEKLPPSPSTGPRKPIPVNAFELITMSRGLDLSHMFIADKKNTDVKRYTTFNSNKQPQEILARIVEQLKILNAQYQLFDDSYKIKFRINGVKGVVGVTVQVLYLAPGMHIVEFRKGKGDIFEYHKLFQDLYEKVKDIIVK